MSGEEKKDSVAPGYPAVNVLREIDVTGFEPAAVFHPVTMDDDGEAR